MKMTPSWAFCAHCRKEMTSLNEWEKLRRQAESLKKQYPKGTVIRLRRMNNEPDMPEGLTGTVTLVDDIGQIHMAWENGSGLPLVMGQDCFEVVRKPAKNKDEPCR